MKELWKNLRNNKKQQLVLLLFLMILSSFLEVASIGALLPFLGALTAPEQVFHNEIVQLVLRPLKISSPEEMILPFTLVFVFTSVLAGMIRLWLLYLMTRFSYATGADLSIDIYERTLYQEYEIHVNRNSSEVINGILTKTNIVINGVVGPILVLLSSIVLIASIFSALLFVDIFAAFAAFTGFGSLYIIVTLYSRKKVKENSLLISKNSTQMMKSLQEGLGGIRNVLIDGSQKYYSNLYRDADIPFRRASGENQFIGDSPRYVMESIGMVIIALIAYNMSLREGGTSMVIPILGTLALGMQRLLPALQQAYSSYIKIKGSQSPLRDIVRLLEQPLPGYLKGAKENRISFHESIRLRGIYFSYGKGEKYILNNLNLKVSKGACIGIIGETGCGKSTLIDTITGLLVPISGELLVDNVIIDQHNIRSWQKHISHVPQDIYLSDCSILENIALGVRKTEINYDLVRKSAEMAQISSLIESWSNKYDTEIGERGVRLSGGQKQRIGIARALYKKSDILILDEATSALDGNTEDLVMKAINELDDKMTIFMIAHRITTLSKCDFIIDIKEGHSTLKTYQEVLSLAQQETK